MFPNPVSGRMPYAASKSKKSSKTKTSRSKSSKKVKAHDPVTTANKEQEYENNSVHTISNHTITSLSSNQDIQSNDSFPSKKEKKSSKHKKLSIQEFVRKFFKISPKYSISDESKSPESSKEISDSTGSSKGKVTLRTNSLNEKVLCNSLDNKRTKRGSSAEDLSSITGSTSGQISRVSRSRSFMQSISRIPRLTSIYEEDEPTVVPSVIYPVGFNKQRRPSSDHFDREALMKQLGLSFSSDNSLNSDDDSGEENDS